MSARTPEVAIDSLLRRFRSVASIITSRPVLRSGRSQSGAIITVGFAPVQEPVALASADRRPTIRLWIHEDYRVVTELPRQARLERTRYTYQILDTIGHEILAFHWHPVGFSSAMHPHLHLSSQLPPIVAGRDQREVVLSDMHLPTGFITLADIVRMLIDEFGVQPLRDDWREVIAARDDAQPVL